jgi:hypothetical protein
MLRVSDDGEAGRHPGHDHGIFSAERCHGCWIARIAAHAAIVAGLRKIRFRQTLLGDVRPGVGSFQR